MGSCIISDVFLINYSQYSKKKKKNQAEHAILLKFYLRFFFVFSDLCKTTHRKPNRSKTDAIATRNRDNTIKESQESKP